MARPLPADDRAWCHDQARTLTDRGMTAAEIAVRLGVSKRTVERWRVRFDWINPNFPSPRNRRSSHV